MRNLGNGALGVNGPITQCQSCSSTDLKSVIFLGYLPPVNALRPIGAPFEAEPWFPAEMLYCSRCHLVQLGYAADPQVLFPPEYPYTSGSTRILRQNFTQLQAELVELTGLAPADLVVDVGSNDGTLLSVFAAAGQRVVGIEPTLTAKLAEQRGIPSIESFFNADAVQTVQREFGLARVVTATNVFAHVQDVHTMIDNICSILDSGGVFVSESHYLADLIATLQYDTIYHEHLRYYSLTSLRNLLEPHGLQIFHVSRIPTHGGSIRVYATRGDRLGADVSVERLLESERNLDLASDRWISDFSRRVVRSKLALYELVAPLVNAGKHVYGVGAPSRASTLVTYVGLGRGILDYVLEVPSSKKIDMYLPGTNVPVVDEARLYADQPEYALLLSWHIADELYRNLTRAGFAGDFIVPLPESRIVTSARART